MSILNLEKGLAWGGPKPLAKWRHLSEHLVLVRVPARECDINETFGRFMMHVDILRDEVGLYRLDNFNIYIYAEVLF